MLKSSRHVRVLSRPLPLCLGRRSLLTLAIETSCDDTSVAILEKYDQTRHNAAEESGHTTGAKLHFHEKITSNNLAHRGIHPVVALESHEQNLAQLVQDAIKHLPYNPTSQDTTQDTTIALENGKSVLKPNFITVTRGPGMRSNLSTGLNTAKGLSVAWQVPLLAINHMQAHALTPRLVTALNSPPGAALEPKFPFLSLLISGGHTMLIHSKNLVDHPTIAETSDIAIGDAIDKIAREILPQNVLAASKSAMYGPLLETFAFPTPTTTAEPDYAYEPPRTREAELTRRITRYGWGFSPPLAETKSGAKSKALEFSFTGLCSAAKRIGEQRGDVLDVEERKQLAREAMRVAFEHLASRVVLYLHGVRKMKPEVYDGVDTLVVSGGVAANEYLRHILRKFLNIRGYTHIKLSFPPLELCTDNAAMIAWTGMEMYEAGYRSELNCQALRKWSLDAGRGDGGILGVGGWGEGGAVEGLKGA